MKKLVLLAICFTILFLGADILAPYPTGSSESNPYEDAVMPTKLIFDLRCESKGLNFGFESQYIDGTIYCSGKYKDEKSDSWPAFYEFYNLNEIIYRYNQVKNSNTPYVTIDDSFSKLLYREENLIPPDEVISYWRNDDLSRVGKGVDGKVFVTARGTNRILMFKNDKLVKTFKIPEHSGVMVDKSNSPTGKDFLWKTPRPDDVAQSPVTKKIYVIDPANYRVEVFDENANYLGCIDDPQRDFTYSGYMAIDSKGNIFIGKTANFPYIIKITKDHEIVRDVIGGKGYLREIGKGFFEGYLKGLCIDKYDRIIALDYFGNINVFDNDGNFIYSLSDESKKYQIASMPSGISVTDDGKIFICEGMMTHTFRVFQILDDIYKTNNSPTLSSLSNKTVYLGQQLKFQISATDQDGDSLSYSVSGKPSGASFSSSTQYFTWTPTTSDRGSGASPKAYTVTFTVTDNRGGTDSKTITITVKYPSPGKPANPSPSDNASNVLTNTDLDWTDASNATEYEVYFGTSSNSLSSKGTVTSSSFSSSKLGTLQSNKKYYWKVTAKNPDSSTSGDIWCFTTKSGQTTSTTGTGTWCGNGSIISYSSGTQTGYGFTKDMTMIHPSSQKPVVFFQWEVDSRDGTKLQISTDSSSSSVNKATITYGTWNDRSKDKTYTNVTLPFTIDPTKDGWSVSNGNWFVIQVAFTNTVSSSETVRAQAASTVTSYGNHNISPASTASAMLVNGYKWCGNGSIISYSSGTQTGYGFTKDMTMIHPSSQKPVVFFQWEVDSRDGTKLQISTDSSSSSVNKATITYGTWNDRSKDKTYTNVTLPFTIDPTKDGWSVSNGNWFVIQVAFTNTVSSSETVRAQASF
jgi:hypothetical protein